MQHNCVTEKMLYLFYIYHIVPRESFESLGSTMSIVYTIFVMLFMTNSCMNPLIYAKLHKSFRRRTLQMFCSCISERYSHYNWNSAWSVVSTSVVSSKRRVHKSISSLRQRGSSSLASTKSTVDGSCQSSESGYGTSRSSWVTSWFLFGDDENDVFLENIEQHNLCIGSEGTR